MKRRPASDARRTGAPPRWLRRAVLAGIGVALSVALPGSGRAHGGPPLRLGVTRDPTVAAVARLTLVHLREGVGFAVDWREFPDAAALRAAFAGGRVDIAVDLAGTGRPAAASAAGCPPEAITLIREDLGRRYGGEVYLLDVPAAEAACVRPALVVSRAVLQDPRFGILGKEAARLVSLLAREDVAAVDVAANRGGERAATAAAREALAAKGRR